MPGWQGRRPLKQWRYVGVYGPELMICLGSVRVGPVRQSFWGVWDRGGQRLHGRTRVGARRRRPRRGPRAGARPRHGHRPDLGQRSRASRRSRRAAASYAWTRKQGGVPVSGTVRIGAEEWPVDARAIIDDTAAYYQRHTTWWWSAGVGRSEAGAEVAWNLVKGVNDSVTGSERSVWVDGVAQEPPPSEFADDLSRVDGLSFASEAVRENNENYGLLRSRYRQPFGTYHRHRRWRHPRRGLRRDGVPRRALVRPARADGRLPPCGSGSTSPTTAPTSADGRPSPACGRCRGSCRRPWPPPSGCRRSTSWSPVAPTPAYTRAGRWCTPTSRTQDDLILRRLNGILPRDIRVRRVAEAPPGFHARFGALWRRYAYRVADSAEVLDPLTRRHVLAWGRSARPRRDEQGVRAAGRPPRLRVVLQAARGRHHDPHPARPDLGARRGRGRGGHACGPMPSATAWCARWSAA